MKIEETKKWGERPICLQSLGSVLVEFYLWATWDGLDGLPHAMRSQIAAARREEEEDKNRLSQHLPLFLHFFYAAQIVFFLRCTNGLFSTLHKLLFLHCTNGFFSTLHKLFFFYAAQIVGLDLPISNCNSSFDSRLNKVEHWNIGELWKLSDKNKAARGRVIIYLPEEESFKE